MVKRERWFQEGFLKLQRVEQIISTQRKEVKAWAKVYLGSSIEHQCGDDVQINSSLHVNHGINGLYFLDDHVS